MLDRENFFSAWENFGGVISDQKEKI